MTLVEFIAALFGVTAAMSVIMSLAWLVWRLTGNSGWVDTIWTFGLGLTGFVAAVLPAWLNGADRTQREMLVALLVVIWSLRLGLHIAQRTTGITDDPRYAKLVEQWGTGARWQMFLLLQKQALVSIPLAMAMLLAAWNPLPGLRIQDMIGALVLVIAIAGEGIADTQLRRFRIEPRNKGRICDVGLWRWSRHPNYFFEWFGWLAYPLLAISLDGSYPWGFVALAGPACMYWLLVHVSGIPPLEAHMVKTRGDAFRAYRARTNAFFPAPPRDGAKP